MDIILDKLKQRIINTYGNDWTRFDNIISYKDIYDIIQDIKNVNDMELHFNGMVKQLNPDDLDLILMVVQMNDNLKEKIRTELWDEHNGYND